ncbi:MAG: ammonium transporter [Eubacteriales bacterium]|nr:ammonium transporter [Eubacteriales bacterium]
MFVFSGIDTLWVLLGAALVFFMQAGFAMVETGFTRAKNAGNIIMKNLMDFAIGTPLYWLVGFGLMFGGSGALIGGLDFLSLGDYSQILPSGVPKGAFLIFQTVFCATAATIVSGAMAERTKFSSYCIYSAVISLLIYPISGHWIWGGGWLSNLGFHDFAGSTAVHMVGGVSALIGAKIIGPRIGKFDANGKPRAIPGHSLTLGALGVFILWFCWFGFNGCSTVSMSGDAIVAAGDIFVTTNLAAAVATVAVMCITWVKYKKPDVSMTLNGSLAGLVAITAGCDTVSPLSAAIIGVIAGFAVVFGIEFIEKKLKIDDPVGAVGVHGVCGALGTLMVGLFSNGAGTGGVKGLFVGGGFSLLGTQILGVASVILWVTVTVTILFLAIRKFHGLRVEPAVELSGLDISEHGISSSYADFMPAPEPEMKPVEKKPRVEPVVPADGEVKFTKISIVCRQNQLEALKNALGSIGVTGLTVTQVLGCGTQNGQPEYYRGAPVGMTLLPKLKVEVVVSKVPVRVVVETAKKALYTGHIGDGKMFVYDVENVIRVRTGEEGYEALQDD